MLYYLFSELIQYVSGLNVFRYITTRATAAAITALLISILFGPLFLRLLHRFQVKEKIREEGPEAHKDKEAGTLTPVEKKMMEIARALAMKPKLLLMDL